MDADLQDLFRKVDRLEEPDPMSEAALRLVSELSVQLRVAERERLVAEERLSEARARASSAEEQMMREKQMRDAAEQEMRLIREESAKLFNQLADERGRRMDAEAELIAMRGEHQRMGKEMEGMHEKREDKMGAEVKEMLSQIQRQLLAMSAPQQAASYEFDIQRDGAGIARRITARPA